MQHADTLNANTLHQDKILHKEQTEILEANYDERDRKLNNGLLQNNIMITLDSEEINCQEVQISMESNHTTNNQAPDVSANNIVSKPTKTPSNDVASKQPFLDLDGTGSSMNSKRLVTKEGIVDIKYVNMPGIKSRFLRDLFHTLMDARWRYNCLLFTLSFIISWVFFGTIWYIIVHFRKINCVDNVRVYMGNCLPFLHRNTDNYRLWWTRSD